MRSPIVVLIARSNRLDYLRPLFAECAKAVREIKEREIIVAWGRGSSAGHDPKVTVCKKRAGEFSPARNVFELSGARIAVSGRVATDATSRSLPWGIACWRWKRSWTDDEDRWLTNGSNIRKRDDGGSVAASGPGWPKFGWLKTSNASARNCRLSLSVSFCVLDQGEDPRL